MRPEDLRKEFPALSRKVYGKDLVYFDNAATVQRPQCVLELWDYLSRNSNANIHRAVHKMADEATEAYEQARLYVKDFINAGYREEIIFTSGATASVNLVAYSFGERFVNAGDEIIVTECEHHSDIIPWQLLCERKHAVLKVLPTDDTGHLKLEMLDSLITDRTKLMAVTHISNVLGLRNPVARIVEKCHSRGVKVLIDGAQGIVHSGVDVREIDCDFYVFSGHKVYAVPGTGVLYGKKELLEQMPPFMGGGEMVGTVKFSGTTYAPLPLKFEAGTQNFTGTATLKPALELAAEISRDRELHGFYDGIRDYLYSELMKVPGLRLFGTTDDMDEKIPLFSSASPVTKSLFSKIQHPGCAVSMKKQGSAVSLTVHPPVVLVRKAPVPKLYR